MMCKILIVDDDQKICIFLKVYLEKNQYEVCLVYDGVVFLIEFQCFVDEFLLVILDVMLFDIDGFVLCKVVCCKFNVLVIMFIVSFDEIDCVVGLELGVDDYIVKFYSLCELLVCIKVIYCCIGIDNSVVLCYYCFVGFLFDMVECIFIDSVGEVVFLIGMDY